MLQCNSFGSWETGHIFTGILAQHAEGFTETMSKFALVLETLHVVFLCNTVSRRMAVLERCILWGLLLQCNSPTRELPAFSSSQTVTNISKLLLQLDCQAGNLQWACACGGCGRRRLLQYLGECSLLLTEPRPCLQEQPARALWTGRVHVWRLPSRITHPLPMALRYRGMHHCHPDHWHWSLTDFPPLLLLGFSLPWILPLRLLLLSMPWVIMFPTSCLENFTETVWHLSFANYKPV